MGVATDDINDLIELRALASALDYLSCAVLLATGRGRPLLGNRAAADLLASADGLTQHGGVLATADAASGRRLRQILQRAAKAAPDDDSPSGATTVPRPSPRSQYLVVAGPPRLTDIEGPLPAAVADGLVLLFIHDLDGIASHAPVVLRQLFGATDAETRVALLLLRGRTVAEIAATLQNSLATVRTHVRRLLHKTETKRQADLMRVLLAAASTAAGSRVPAKGRIGRALSEAPPKSKS